MRYLAWCLVPALLILAVNLAWLATSTVRIHNASGRALDGVGYTACSTDHVIGALGPGESAFRLLEACGDDTLDILIGESRFCRLYVEGELYHVDAKIIAPNRVECEYDDPFSGLLVLKALF